MKGVFVTATDTGAGKSVVTGLLAGYLRCKGYRIITQKWVQTGSLDFPSDIAVHLKIMGIARKDIMGYLGLVCPYALKFPASPHLAARAERKKISRARIKDSFKSLAAEFDFVIVEGIGGALVPIDKKHLVIDIVKELNLPVLVVAGNKLGAINHTLLTIEALRRRKLKILGVVFRNPKKGDRLILRDNPRIVSEISRVKILGILPWSKNQKILAEHFKKIGSNIIGAGGMGMPRSA